jgi:hypothetical protein
MWLAWFDKTDRLNLENKERALCNEMQKVRALIASYGVRARAVAKNSKPNLESHANRNPLGRWVTVTFVATASLLG